MHEHGAVLGSRNVPLQTLEHQGTGHIPAGGDDIGIDLLDADLGVLHRAVVGDHHPAEAVGVGVPDLIDHPVLAVRGELGVDVMIAGQPPVPTALPVHRLTGGSGRRRRCGRRGQHADRRARAQHTGGLEEPPASQFVRRQVVVLDLQIHDGAQHRRFASVMAVPVTVGMFVDLAAVAVLHR